MRILTVLISVLLFSGCFDRLRSVEMCNKKVKRAVEERKWVKLIEEVEGLDYLSNLKKRLSTELDLMYKKRRDTRNAIDKERYKIYIEVAKEINKGDK